MGCVNTGPQERAVKAVSKLTRKYLVVVGKSMGDC